MWTVCALDVLVYASMQSCDGSEYALQGPAGGDDITGLSAEPAHYQLLAELGEHVRITVVGQWQRGEIVHDFQHKSTVFHFRSNLFVSQGGASTT